MNELIYVALIKLGVNNVRKIDLPADSGLNPDVVNIAKITNTICEQDFVRHDYDGKSINPPCHELDLINKNTD